MHTAGELLRRLQSAWFRIRIGAEALWICVRETSEEGRKKGNGTCQIGHKGDNLPTKVRRESLGKPQNPSTRRSSQRFPKSIWFPFSSINPHSKSPKHVEISLLEDVLQKDYRTSTYSSRHIMFLIDSMSIVCLFLSTRTHTFRRCLTK